MRAADLIRKKRDRQVLSASDIAQFVSGVTDGSLADYQASAFLMAVFLNGMTAEETAALTSAMVASGGRVDLTAIPGFKVDKHSTGGVGDKTSLILAPLAAACGVVVPMMSGRALGHTGGTLDKLESIPGFRTSLSIDEFKETLATVGCALIGQTAQIAPADRKLYALRDVTSTVESIPLITASIMSKKIAEGIDGLVLDVKVGRGAFMKTEAEARRLAESLVRTGEAAGVKTEAVLTAMDAPLGRMVGNALEVVECIATLRGRGPADLENLSVGLAARMVRMAGVCATLEDAERRVRDALASGAGLEKFRDIVAAQHGDPRAVDDPSRLPSAPYSHVITADRSGVVAALDAELIGHASNALGAGRDRVDALVDPAVGLIVHAPPGQAVKAGDAVLELRYTNGARLPRAVALATEAIVVSDRGPAAVPAVLGTIEGCTEAR